MTEYIEREKVLSKAAPVAGCFSDMISAYDVVMLPAADVAPLRHGRWIEHEDGVFTCSECGNAESNESYFCRYCGAKMDGGAE